MLEANEQADAAYEPAPLGLRIAALAVDCSAGWASWLLTVASVSTWNTARSNDVSGSPPRVPPSTASTMVPDQLTFGDLVLEFLWDFALITYMFFAVVFIFRFLVSLVFGTTPGRKLIGLLIVTHADMRSANRMRVAFREFLALLIVVAPLVNLVWIVRILRNPEWPGWHEWISETAVVRAS